MGRIAPRKRASPETDYQGVMRAALSFLQHLPAMRIDNARRLPSFAVSVRMQSLRSTLKALWHRPDSYRWMEPLPPFHRRWILIATVLLLVVLLWPYTPPTPRTNNTATPITLNESAPMQANLINRTPPPPARTAAPSWQTYHIVAGQTLAQLFRDNNLPVNDVFAMAQVEGRDKPLSNLRAGQAIKLQLNAQGMVTELEIETTEGQVVHFSRQADGVFLRTR